MSRRREQSFVGDLTAFGLVSSALDYMVDRAQRSVLFWDIMRQRGNQYREHLAENIPHILHFKAEAILEPNTQTLCFHRSARGTWSWHWRLQAGKRDRRGVEVWLPLLFHWLPASAHSGPNDRGYCSGRGDFPRKDYFHASRRRGQALRGRQLSGRLGGDDGGRDAS